MTDIIKALRREDVNRMDMLRERLAAADAISTLQAEVERLNSENLTWRRARSDAEARAETAKARIKKLEAALERSSIALDDWLNVYAEDMCDEKRVAEAKQRISEFGTLAYIAFVQDQNRTALRSREGEK